MLLVIPEKLQNYLDKKKVHIYVYVQRVLVEGTAIIFEIPIFLDKSTIFFIVTFCRSSGLTLTLPDLNC